MAEGEQRESNERATREHGGSTGESTSEQRGSMGSSEGADGQNRPWRGSKAARPESATDHVLAWVRGNYIYNIYTPNLGLRVVVFDREREQ